MHTSHLILDPDDPVQAESRIAEAAGILKRGGLVAFPTETVYGLGANALDPAAVAAIFEAKQRPFWDPLIVHVADEPMLLRVVSEIPERAHEAMRQFWPGPLTLLLPRSPNLPERVTAGREKVAVRMPAFPHALALIRMAGLPIAAPSANLFGRPSPTTAAHVLSDLNGRIDAVLDSGPTRVGLESTVLDLTLNPPVIYRAGAVSREQLREVLGDVVAYHPATGEIPESLPSPGVGIRHYAPTARLVLVPLADLVATARAYREKKIGIMLPDEVPGHEIEAAGAVIFRWGSFTEPATLARNLFAGLRTLDECGVETILCPMPGEGQGLFAAIRDRLAKAARES